MKELEVILKDIFDVYNSGEDNDKKFIEVSKLWTKYYKLT